jgi:predicted DNA-binding transcriptional regulator AlpA
VQRTILRPGEVSEMTGVPEDTLKYWRHQAPERGPRWFKIGKTVVYDLAEIDAWLDEQRRTTGPDAA